MADMIASAELDNTVDNVYPPFIVGLPEEVKPKALAYKAYRAVSLGMAMK